MPVVLQTPVVPAAPSYDKVHLDHLTITQEQTDYSKVVIQARVRLYNQQGLLVLTGRNLALRDAIRRYHDSRNEDSIDLE